MAKIVNNFIKGKMNKDLDDRLIPNGEYRNAVNTQVSKSEGNNVGALENSIGNTLVADFSDILGEDVVSIGFYSDEINNRVFLFLTNNYDTAYDPSKTNAIVCYNAGSGATDILVEEKVGQAFLNFYVGNPITGVNLLENLLFFTDNRNQPRVINVDTALNDPTYYDSEDLISVAKYYPFENINLYRQAANVTPSGPNQDFETTMFDATSLAYPDGGSGTVLGPFPGPSANIDLDRTSIQGTARAGMNIAYLDASNNLVDSGETVLSVDFDDTPTTCRVVASGAINIGTNNTTFIFQFNPYFEGKYNGDKDFLLKKFVRFAYRFKYNDGEYSIFSPFTQECFIPQQDGYFMYDVENVDSSDTGANVPIPINLTSEEDTYRTTTVEFMQNKVDKIITNTVTS